MRTFVVRIWDGTAGQPATYPGALRGIVEEVETGEATRFTGGEELLGVLERPGRRSPESRSGPIRSATDGPGLGQLKGETP